MGSNMVKRRTGNRAQGSKGTRGSAVRRRAESLLERVLSSIGILIAYLDRDFRFTWVNRAYAEADGKTPEFFVGKNHFDLFPNEENERIFRRVLETGEPHVAYEKPFVYARNPERGVTFWDWSVQPVLEDDGTVGGLVLGLVDVTRRVRAREAARMEAAFRKGIEESLLCGIAAVDPEGRQTYVNPAFCRMVGWSEEELLGALPPFVYWPPEEQERIAREFRSLLKTGEPRPMEMRLRRKNGERFDALVLPSPIFDGEGKPLGWIASVNDVSEQKENQRRTEATNEVLKWFSRAANRKEYLDGILDLVHRWSGCRCAGIRVVVASQHIPYESYVGFSQQFWESENWLSLEQDQCACIRVVLGKPDPQDLPVMTRAGSFLCNDTESFVGDLSNGERSRFRGACMRCGFRTVAIVPVRYRDKILGAIHLADERPGVLQPRVAEFIETIASIVGEAVHRFNLETELRRSEARLRQVSSELLNAQENERKRISREIHDSIGQCLNAIKYRLEDTLLRESRAEMEERLRNLVPIVQEAVEETRRIQTALRPPILDDLGILATLNWFLREFQNTYRGIKVHRTFAVAEEEIPEALKTVIYRVTQEALNNVAKHSRAKRVSLSLERGAEGLELSIRDNGVGFEPAFVAGEEGERKGMGMTSMRERVALSGGTFSVVSAPGAGTTVTASWQMGTAAGCADPAEDHDLRPN